MAAYEKGQEPIDAVRRHPTPSGPRNLIRHVIGACRAIKTSERLEYGGAHRSPLFAGIEHHRFGGQVQGLALMIDMRMNHDRKDRTSALKRQGKPLQPLIVRRSRRSEEHTSELQSLMRISYAVFCLQKKKNLHKINKQKIV